ncbi:MAG: efflux RND transporter permease subunit, partial [Rhodothermaceae bacterium]
MQSLIRYFIKYPVLGNVIIVALVLFGMLGYMNMRTTFFPPVPSKMISISATYPGASPQEIEEGIILKIEDNLKSVTGIDRTTSVSRENSGSITVEIESSSDLNLVLEDVKNAVNRIPSFPVGMEPVVVSKVEPREFGISFAVSGDVSLKTLKEQARKIERDLLNKEGISKLSLSGFPAEEIEIAFRENDLRRYNLTFAQALSAVQKNNILTTGGKIKTSKEELLIRANLRGYYASEIENSVVRALPDGTILRLKDIANVNDRWSENPNRVYFNGKPAVTVELQTTNDEDLFILVELVTQYIDEFNSKDQIIKLDVLRDGSKVIKQRSDLLEENGIIGIFLVVLLLSLFLNFRLSFWVALAIPLAFLGMFALGALYGMTINVMSLLAMILVIGILVDDGIVIAENIYQHYERGEKPMKAAVNGTLEVLPAVSSAIMTTILAFLVFWFLEGAMGDRARDIAFVVVGTLVISLLEGVLILPAHIAHSKALHTKSTDKSKLEKKMESIFSHFRDKYYAPVLNFSLSHPSIALAVPIAALIITFGALKGSLIKTTFFPVVEIDRVDAVLELPAGSRDHVVDSILVYMEKKVWQANEEMKKERADGKDVVELVTRKVGPGTHQGSLGITLLDGEIRKVSIIDMNNLFRDKIGPIPEAEKLTYGLNRRWGMPVSVSIVGGNLKEIREAKNDMKNEFLKMRNLKDVQDNDPPGLREVEITLKEKAYALGLNAADVMNQVRAGFFGGQAQRILRGIDEVKVWVRYEDIDRNSISKLEDMRIRLANGNSYPLREIADLSIVRGVMSINH